jgi:hypothetical protein
MALGLGDIAQKLKVPLATFARGIFVAGQKPGEPTTWIVLGALNQPL